MPSPASSAGPSSLNLVDGLTEALHKQPAAPMLQMWRALASGEQSFDDAYARMAAADELTCLTVDTTGACDLTCEGMCYYHPDISVTRREAPLASVVKAIEDARDLLRMQTLVFAGKEPFVNARRLFDLLSQLPPREHRAHTVGIVTNGRHLERHWEQLTTAVDSGRLDFMDVSIDSGDAVQHDSIRGVVGTYERAITGARKLAIELPGLRTGLTSVLRSDNAVGILSLIRSQAATIKHFWVFPIQPPPFSLTSRLRSSHVLGFVRDLIQALQTDLRDAAVDVTVPLQGLYLADVIRREFFAWSDVREDAAGATYVTLPIESNTLMFQCSVLPEQAWRLGRVTYTGDYLAHIHFLQTPDPSQAAVGNVATESVVDLFRRATRQGSVFETIVKSRNDHECRRWQCWDGCFGGWSVAEQSLLDGNGLSRRPRLCTKSEAELIQVERGRQ